MEYPLEILPKSNYRKLDIPIINEINNIFLIRRSLKSTLKETFSSNNLVRIDALVQEGSGRKFKNYSLNILGGLFEEKHISFIQKGKAIEDWTMGETIRIEEYKDCYRTENSIPIFFLLGKFHNINIPYHITNAKEIEDEENRKIFSAFNETSNIQVNGKCEVVHVPTKLNFWHVELRSTDINEKDAKLKTVKEQGVGKWHEFTKYLQDNIIKTNAYPNLNEDKLGDIPKQFYIDEQIPKNTI